jgi:DNA primase
VIPQGFIQDLLARADIVDVVGRAVQLKKAGVNYKGLCPFHGEKSPSFVVSPTRQTYHCFGCGVHGNAVGFLMEHAGLGFIDAVRDLASELGVSVPDDDSTPQDRDRAQREREQRQTLSQVLAKASAHYRVQLKGSQRAIQYLKGRGLTGEIAARFGLGYAPGGWHSLASVFAQYDDPLLVESGMVILQGEDGSEQRRYDRFRDRVMFPIRNPKGEVIGFGGRILDQGEPKYLNSPETPVFVKGRELYGLFEARVGLRKRGYALVTEGYMDVVALAQLGFENAVATLGTACTADHVAKLLRFTEQIVFSFDGDAAGRRAAARAMEAVLPHATDTRSFRFLFLPAEHDPDTYVREFGAEAFEQLIHDALPLSRQLLDQAAEGNDLVTPEGRARMLATARPWFGQMPDGLLREQLYAELARAGGVSPEVLNAHWRGESQRSGGKGNRRAENAGSNNSEAAHTPQPGGDPGPWSAEPPPDWDIGESHAPAQREALYNPDGSPIEPDGGPWRSGKKGGKWQGGKGSGRDRPWPRRDTHWQERQGAASPKRPPQRTATRLDSAAWLLVRRSELWLQLSTAVHDELVHQPLPYGEFFAALERVLHDQGVLPMHGLLDELQCETDDNPSGMTVLIQRLRGMLDIESEADPQAEIQIILLELRRDAVKDEMNLLAESGTLSESEQQLYQQLIELSSKIRSELQALRTQPKPA